MPLVSAIKLPREHMNLETALTLINQFNHTKLSFSSHANTVKTALLQQEKGIDLPNELISYIEKVCPDKPTTFIGVGHPIELLSYNSLSWQMKGFNITDDGEEIKNWQEAWFLIATEGGEPIIVDLSDQTAISPVYSAMKTNAGWEFCPIADSIGQFLLCSAAIEHALHFPGVTEPLDEDFNLAPEIANWLFPFIMKHAAAHYDEWLAVFENYLDEL